MKDEFDIWDEVLKTLGFKFKEEYTIWRASNILIYTKDNVEAKLYVKFETGEITSFRVDGLEMFLTFQKQNKELFRAVKINSILD